jgi:hypothetical protein
MGATLRHQLLLVVLVAVLIIPDVNLGHQLALVNQLIGSRGTYALLRIQIKRGPFLMSCLVSHTQMPLQ